MDKTKIGRMPRNLRRTCHKCKYLDPPWKSSKGSDIPWQEWDKPIHKCIHPKRWRLKTLTPGESVATRVCFYYTPIESETEQKIREEQITDWIQIIQHNLNKLSYEELKQIIDILNLNNN